MAPRSETLGRVAAASGGRLEGPPGIEVTDVTHDSRSAGPGVLFTAIRGANVDGHRFVEATIEAGSPAAMVDHLLDLPVPQIVVPDTRKALGPAAAAVHGHPSAELALIGVTGTNGKTTVTHMVEDLANRVGLTAGLIGTIHTRVAGETVPTIRTTPEASDFQRLLRKMADKGARLIAAEVSSHALAFHRVAGSRFAAAAFTNLSQDHLDFHGTMDDYRAAKESLFDPALSQKAVINVDDPVGAEIAARCAIPVLTTGSKGVLSAADVRSDLTGTEFTLVHDGSAVGRGRLPLAGDFNLSNALVALGCLMAIEVPLTDALSALGGLSQVPGRFEIVHAGGPVVVVDYAHSPDGIDKVIDTVRRSGDRRIIVVLGAGGDRDRGKRPAMGASASAADRVVITSDNPRSEDPDAIIRAVIEGVGSDVDLVVEPDRRMAIRSALGSARRDDVVLVLGRGHERFQEVAGEMIPFDDRSVVREELAGFGMVDG